MVKVLVTGAAGFIGSSLVEGLLNMPGGCRVVGVDNGLTGRLGNLPDHSNFKFIKADLNRLDDISAIMVCHDFDYVFHYAAVVGVQRTLANPIMVLDDIRGIQHVLHLSKNTGVKRVFFSSSSEVYGEPVEFPQNELTTPLNSKLPYAVVKNVGEAFLRSYQQEHGLDYTIFRFFNTYGPKQSEDFVVSRFLAAAHAGEPLTIYGDGSQTRTFCYIDDNIDATIECLRGQHHINDTVNIGSDNELSILTLAQTVLEVTNSRSELKHLPPLPEGDMTRRFPDSSKMKNLLKRKPVPLREGLERVYRAYQGATSYVHS